MSSQEDSISAQELLEALRAFEPRIPSYTQLTTREIYALRRAATLSADWIQETVNVVGASSSIAAAIGSTYGELREEIVDVNQWSSVEKQLYAMYKGVRAANLVRRHRIGLTALQAYGILRQLIRRREHSDLLPYYQRLQEMNKLGKRKKKDEEPDPVTE